VQVGDTPVEIFYRADRRLLKSSASRETGRLPMQQNHRVSAGLLGDLERCRNPWRMLASTSVNFVNPRLLGLTGGFPAAAAARVVGGRGRTHKEERPPVIPGRARCLRTAAARAEPPRCRKCPVSPFVKLFGAQFAQACMCPTRARSPRSRPNEGWGDRSPRTKREPPRR
jgi:hypothetical protein